MHKTGREMEVVREKKCFRFMMVYGLSAVRRRRRSLHRDVAHRTIEEEEEWRSIHSSIFIDGERMKRNEKKKGSLPIGRCPSRASVCPIVLCLWLHRWNKSWSLLNWADPFEFWELAYSLSRWFMHIGFILISTQPGDAKRGATVFFIIWRLFI